MIIVYTSQRTSLSEIFRSVDVTHTPSHVDCQNQECEPNVTPCSRYLLRKLTVLLLDKKLPAFFECRNFVIVFKQATTCPYPELLLSIPIFYINSLRLFLIPFSHLVLGLLSCLLPWDFPHKILSAFLFSPYALYASPTTSSSFCDPKNFGEDINLKSPSQAIFSSNPLPLPY